MKVTRDESIRRATAVKVDDGLVPHRLVLRYLPDSVHPWVTHEESMKLVPDAENEEGMMLVHRSYYWGNYFEREEEAIADYEKRKERFR